MSSTIVNRLYSHVQVMPDAIAFRYLQELDAPCQELTYRVLWQSAGDIAVFLKKIASSGSRIMLFFPPGLAYVEAFYGCLLAGMVAVPLYPPRRNTKSDRIVNVAQSCQSVIALTTQSELMNVETSWNEQNTVGISLSIYAVDNIPAVQQEVMHCPLTEMSATAFLQYTSGSTGVPKGVIISHENIIANLTHLSLMTSATQKDVFVNWVPMFHDLGLVSAILWPVFLGASSVLMAPATFVRAPVIWLEAISRFHGSMGGAPNFAYDLCSQKISDADMSTLDLRSWRVAYNASEPVRAETIIRFSERFSVCGFRPETFYPSYGMAEATVFISGGKSSVKPILVTLNKKSIAAHKFELAEAGHPMATRMVACGAASLPHDVRIVDPDTGRELVDGDIGEIWFAGPSVSPGYWGLEELSQATFEQRIADQSDNTHRYLRTGDLGAIWNNEVFITGRMKDLIILHGKNYYPQDIEYSASAAHVAIREGYCAAFSVDEDDAERLVLVAEIKRDHFRTINADDIISAIRQRIAFDHEVNVDYLVLVKPHKVPVTSSGKIQRKKTRQLFLDQELDVIAQISAERETSYIAPRSETERMLCSIWCCILKQERVGIFDNFFDIGGNSLSALEIAAEVHKKFNLINIDTELFFEFPTVAKLAQILDSKVAYAKSNAVVTPGRNNFPLPYECATSLAQQRMLFMEELAGHNSYYNIPVAYKIHGPLDKTALLKSLSRLVARHDILRSTYRLKDNVYVQRVGELATLQVNEIFITGERDRASALQSLLEKEAHHVFDLANDWPIRISLLECDKYEHVLAINIHHIAADGWSARRIVGEISAGYRLYKDRDGVDDAERDYQYADYVQWQTEWQKTSHYAAARDYWNTSLRGIPELHSLPTDFVRPAIQTVLGDTYTQITPAIKAAAITATASVYQTTPFTIFQAAFAAFLARYSGESDIVFGTAAANRQPLEFINTVGLFVNTLVLRYSVTDDVSYDDLIKQAMNVGTHALRFQQFPFDAVVDELQPARSLGYNPLVQIMLVMQESSGNHLILDGTEVVQLEQHQKVSKFDLALHVTSDKDEVAIRWEYNTSLFKLSTIKTMAFHFECLLDICLSSPNKNVNDIPLVPVNTKDIDVDASKFPEPVCIHLLFERHAQLHPDDVAAIEGDYSITYKEVNERADHIASHIHAVNGNDVRRIGLCMEKSIGLLVGMLAIMKVGATYVPLDPHYPRERLDWMLQDSEIDVLLTSNDTKLPTGLNEAIPVLRVEQLLETAVSGQHNFAMDVNAGAYIIYTSGSTGKPKGVLVSHRSLFYSLHSNRALMGIDRHDMMPTIGSQAFGVSILEILLPLTSGGTVRIIRKSQVTDLEQLLEVTNNVTVLHAVPSLMSQWLDAVQATTESQPYPALRLLLVGGESVPDKLLKRIKQWRPEVRLLELYGMTESAVVCSSYAASKELHQHYCIGKPHATIRFHVLNSCGQQQPVGVPGELHISGLSLADAYINQPESTAEKFIISRHLAAQRLYRTGDRVRLLDDGNYEFLGRMDHQVSLRGVRIELGEIETLAADIEGIKQAVAHVADLSSDEKILVLYYTSHVGSPDQTAMVEIIGKHLARYLPDYMRPSLVQRLESFPLNPNGKVDRKKLPAPHFDSTIAIPETDIERCLADMWLAVLQRDSVSVTANFFEMGGHSLMATKLATRIRDTFDIAIPLTVLFESPSIRQCAQFIERTLKEKYARSLIRHAVHQEMTEDEELIL